MKTISRTQYLELLGLLVLAQRHTRQLNDLQNAVESIVGEEGNLTHSGDAIWSGDDAEAAVMDLLLKVDIKVVE